GRHPEIPYAHTRLGHSCARVRTNRDGDTVTTIDTTAITVELPEAFDPRWSRLPGIQVDRSRITIDSAEHVVRFESSAWLVANWELVKSQLLEVDETTESAVEQLALDFIKQHSESTSDAARVLATAYEVYAYLFREEHLAGLGLPQITADHLRMLREAATLMALNKVELDGHRSEERRVGKKSRLRWAPYDYNR